MIKKSEKEKKKLEEKAYEKTIEDGSPQELEEQRTKALEKVDENEHKVKLLEEEAKDLKPVVEKAESEVKKLEVLAVTEKNPKSQKNVENVVSKAKNELEEA